MNRNTLESDGRPGDSTAVHVPNDLCTTCPNCSQMLLKEELERTLLVCPKCGHHLRMSARKRILSLCDDNSFEAVSYTHLDVYKRQGALRLAAVEGDEKKGCFLCGQIAGMIHRPQKAAKIIEEMFCEADEVLKGEMCIRDRFSAATSSSPDRQESSTFPSEEQ